MQLVERRRKTSEEARKFWVGQGRVFISGRDVLLNASHSSTGNFIFIKLNRSKARISSKSVQKGSFKAKKAEHHSYKGLFLDVVDKRFVPKRSMAFNCFGVFFNIAILAIISQRGKWVIIFFKAVEPLKGTRREYEHGLLKIFIRWRFKALWKLKNIYFSHKQSSTNLLSISSKSVVSFEQLAQSKGPIYETKSEKGYHFVQYGLTNSYMFLRQCMSPKKS